uniref:DUF4003 domain-containing protein n=1 Tax=uncultured bacterium fosmid pJB39A3 TaxID=1478063 RepID=A0A0H3U7Q7_9BACT|nr:hypothetical protein [uncultured bacterium fosmid pJB39A3]
MNENIKQTCDLIVENRDALAKKMFWEMDANAYSIMAGLLTTAGGIEADAARYQECKEILKKNAAIFSELRGFSGAMVVIKMMAQADPEAYIKGVSEVYGKLRNIHKLTASPYMVMAAMNIYSHQGTDLSDADIERLEELYKVLKKQHPMLVDDGDRGYLSMIVTSGMDLDTVPGRINDAYEVCKKLSIDKNSVHSMAQILAFSDKSPEEKFEFVDGVLKGLAKNHTPISKTEGLAVLGALALLNIPREQLINDITDASNYLKSKSGFRWYNEGKRLRTVYAALAVFLTYAKDKESLAGAISANIAMNIAEELMMLIIMIAIVTSISSSKGR